MSTTDREQSRTISGDGNGAVQHDRAPRPPRHGRSHVGLYIAVVVALLVGLAAGAIWHGPLTAVFHSHKHAAATAAKQLWTCSMHPQVIKDEPGLCPICHMQLTPLKGDAGSSQGKPASSAERKIKYYWDPMMNPPYISDKPGKSPMGMDLVPVFEDRVSGGTSVTIDPVVVQNMGVRVAKVTTGTITREVRAIGYLDEAQSNVRDVNLRVSGWVEKLHADTVGMALSKGAPLFELYSPEVQVAADELIAARKSLESLGSNADSLAKKTAQTLFDATRLKLEQWGLGAEQVEKLSKLDQPPRSVTFTSPIDGYLTQKMVVQGASVKSGDTVLRIVDLSNVWLDSQVYAQDLPFVRIGGTVSATVEGLPGKPFEGKVIFIQPELDPQTRTATVRIALPNMELTLRPGMYATARIQTTIAKDATLVPREAIIDTGTRQVVFVSAGEGKFEPRQVKVGAEGEGGVVQVLAGLTAGESVVSSGQFLLDAESRMREAVQKHLNGQLLANAPAARVETVEPAATQPATAPNVHVHAAPASQNIDRLFAAYLVIQQALGASQQADTAIDPSPLVDAAKAAIEEGGHAAALAPKVLDAATAFQGKKIAEQRKLFKPLSDATIALARAHPPSAAVAQKLYVAFCPMAPGDGARWLQTTDKIANPYFATSMKECGSIEQTLTAAPQSATSPTTMPATKEGRP
jgi:RND family efflux transporter MFP subunit